MIAYESIETVKGRSLSGVAYYNVPSGDWSDSGSMHVVDYGVELDFEGIYLSLGWEGGSYELRVSNELLGEAFPAAVRSPMVSPPWDDLIGSRLLSARFGHGAHPCEQEQMWVVELEFEGNDRVWVAAASLFAGGDFLIPCSDEVVVAWSADAAQRYGLIVRRN